MKFATRSALAAGAAVLALSLAACGSDNKTSSSSTSSSSSSASGGSSSSGKGLKIAYLAAARGNAFVDASIKAVQDEADKQGVKLSIFDAQFNPGKQLQQCEDAVTQKYDAIVSLAAAGVPLTPCAAQAAAANIPFIEHNQPIGTSTTSGEPSAKGVTSQILTPLATVASNDAKEAAAACGNAKPCDIVLLTAAKLIPVQAAAYEAALNKEKAGNANIKLTTVEAGADRPGGLKAMQDALQRVPHPTVVTAPNTQPIEGAAQALTEAGLTPGKDVQLAANGGTSELLAGVKSGKYFSTYVQLPGTEARTALQYAIKAANGGKVPTSTDPHKVNGVPYEVTKANLGDLGSFTPEW